GHPQAHVQGAVWLALLSGAAVAADDLHLSPDVPAPEHGGILDGSAIRAARRALAGCVAIHHARRRRWHLPGLQSGEPRGAGLCRSASQGGILRVLAYTKMRY